MSINRKIEYLKYGIFVIVDTMPQYRRMWRSTWANDIVWDILLSGKCNLQNNRYSSTPFWTYVQSKLLNPHPLTTMLTSNICRGQSKSRNRGPHITCSGLWIALPAMSSVFPSARSTHVFIICGPTKYVV